MTRNLLAHSILLALAIAAAATPARADHCDDIAAQLGSAIDGLKVGFRAENHIYLSQPLAKEMSVGCTNRNFQNELYAKQDGRKPKPAFINLVGGAAAIVFTLPKDDTVTGTSRCMKRMGLLRGDTIKLRYRRLNYECTRTKTDASIAITRDPDE